MSPNCHLSFAHCTKTLIALIYDKLKTTKLLHVNHSPTQLLEYIRKATNHEPLPDVMSQHVLKNAICQWLSVCNCTVTTVRETDSLAAVKKFIVFLKNEQFLEHVITQTIASRQQYLSSCTEQSLHGSWWWNCGIELQKYASNWITTELMKVVWRITQILHPGHLAVAVWWTRTGSEVYIKPSAKYLC